jgi:hypothetical protein
MAFAMALGSATASGTHAIRLLAFGCRNEQNGTDCRCRQCNSVVYGVGALEWTPTIDPKMTSPCVPIR